MIIMRCCLCFCSKSQNYRVSNFTPEERNVLTTFLQKLENTGNDFRENSGDIKQYKTGVKALIKNFESDNNPKITLSRKQKNNLLRILQILHKHSDNKEKPNFDTVINSKLELLVFLSSKMGSDSSTIQGSRVKIAPLARIRGLDQFFNQEDIDKALGSEVLKNRFDLTLSSINTDDISTFTKRVAEIITAVKELARADDDVKTTLTEGVEAALETITEKAKDIEPENIPEFTKSVAEIIRTVNESGINDDVKNELITFVKATLKNIQEKAAHIETTNIPEFTKSVAEIIRTVNESGIKDAVQSELEEGVKATLTKIKEKAANIKTTNIPEFTKSVAEIITAVKGSGINDDVKNELITFVKATLKTITKKAANIKTTNIPEFTKSVAEIITAVKGSVIKDDDGVKNELIGVVKALPNRLKKSQASSVQAMDSTQFNNSVQELKNTATG